MPKKTFLIDYHACEPERCEKGICKAAKVCEYHVLVQEAPYELPEISPSLCVGCGLCAPECPKNAIRLMM
ncbi:MAG: 4Fe-4S binding protein [Chloroflexota bacterium]